MTDYTVAAELIEKFPWLVSLVVFGVLLWLFNKYIVPLIELYTSQKKMSIDELNKQIEEIKSNHELEVTKLNEQISTLRADLKASEEMHRAELEMSRKRTEELSAQNDQLIGIYIGVNTHLKAAGYPTIPMPSWVKDKIKIIEK